MVDIDAAAIWARPNHAGYSNEDAIVAVLTAAKVAAGRWDGKLV